MGRSRRYHLRLLTVTVALAAIKGDGSPEELPEQSRGYQNSI